MRSLILALVAVGGLALTASTADAQYRGRGGFRGGYGVNRPYYGNSYYRGFDRPYYGGNYYRGGYYGRPYYGGYGYGYPASGFSITVGNGGFYPYGGGLYGGGYYPGWGFRGW